MSVETFRGVVPQWTVADKIRKAREHAGLSQQQLADRLSVTRTSVVNWERGHTRPLRVLLGLLAAETGVDPDWLASDDAKVINLSRLPRVDSNHQPAGWLTDSSTPPSTLELQEIAKPIDELRRRIRRGPIVQTAHQDRTAG
ncbi:MAG TPA: helix-turn-helix domain-containing protein [Jiangellaceae bacterium]|nr:helix-turn-helix domain-containing protein [Jiangellaceae bacterium]